MPAITGNYAPASKLLDKWNIAWIYRSHAMREPRLTLATQLRHIRKNHGNPEAKEFRDHLLWIGVYPVKIRRAA